MAPSPPPLLRRFLLALLCLSLGLASGARAQDLGQRLAEPWRWRELAPPPGNRFHEAISLHPDGRLFSSYGARVSVLEGGQWGALGVARDDIISMGPSGEGVLLLTRDGGCAYLDSEGLHDTLVPTVLGQRISYTPVGDGEALISTRSAYFLFRDGNARTLDLPPMSWIHGLGRTADGRLLATSNGQAWIEQNGDWSELTLEYDPNSPARYGPIYRHGDELWLFPDKQSYSLPPLRFTGTGFEVGASAVDSELAVAIPGHGFLSWHSDHGAQTYYDGLWHDIDHIPGTEGQLPDSAFSDGKHILVQMAAGRLWSIDLASERWSLTRLPPPHEKAQVQSLTPSRRGGLWAGSSQGLSRWQDGVIVEHHAEALGVPLQYLTATQEDAGGRVWVGSGSSFLGVMRLTGERWERVPNPTDDYHVHSIREGPDGALWFTLLSGDGNPIGPAGGLVRFDGESWTHFTIDDGLPDDRCYSVLTRSSGETLVATLRGLARLDGERWTPLPSYGRDPVRLLFESSDGLLWLGAGIRVPGLRTYRGEQEVPLSAPSLARLTIGSILEDPERGFWISGRKGLFLLDHTGLAHEVTQEFGIPARAYWPMLQIANSTFALGSLEGGIVTFKPDDTEGPEVFDLDITVSEGGYTRCSWHARDPWSTTPQESLRYRWRETGGSWSSLFPEPSISLGALAPGEHTFEVQALDQLGNRSPVPARAQFTVLAPFWLRPAVLWTALLVALLVLSLTALAVNEWSRSRELERREADRIAQSEYHYRSLVERVRALIASFNSKGQLTYVSPGLARLLGGDPEQITTKRFLDRIAPEDSPQAAVLRATLLGRRRGGWTGEVPLDPANGSPAWLYATLTPDASHDAQGGASWDFVAVDLTERREGERRERDLEAKLAQSRRLEAIGRLSAGIGHDFNNLLTAIAGNAAIVGKQLEEVGLEALQSNLAEVELATTQAQVLTRRLLSFGRSQEVEPKVQDLDETITAALPLIQRLIQAGVEFSLEPGGAGSTECGEGQLERVLFNLVLNAQDAMPQGGRLIVRTRRLTLDAQAVQEHAPLAPGEYAVLSVQDDGEGMDRATLERACEPFFTTKAEGHGTGLGLATVHGILAQCGGSIEITSAPGEGTTIDAYFPRLTGAARRSSMHATSFGAPEPAAETQTLLFCEDDPGVRSFISQCLREYGYHVLVAEGPEEALEASALHEGPIDLLVTDVVMPVMNGFQLAERLCADRPDMRVLYVSGYGADLLDEEGVPRGEFDLLKKPFRPDALLERVARGLAARPTSRLDA